MTYRCHRRFDLHHTDTQHTHGAWIPRRHESGCSEWGAEIFHALHLARLQHKVNSSFPFVGPNALTALHSFAVEEDLLEFAKAIRASDNPDPELEYIVTSMNEWQAPKDRRTRSRKASERTPDEGREGFSYRLLRWPAFVCSRNAIED